MGRSKQELVLAGRDDTKRAFDSVIGNIRRTGDQVRSLKQAFYTVFAVGGIVELTRKAVQSLRDVYTNLDQIKGKLSEFESIKIEQAANAAARLKEQFMLIGAQILSNLAPYLQLAADWLTELASRSSNFATIGQQTFQYVGTAIQWVADVGHGLRLVYSGAIAIFAKFAEVFWEMIGSVTTAWVNFRRIFDEDYQPPEWMAAIPRIVGEAQERALALRGEFTALLEQGFPGEQIAAQVRLATDEINAQAVAIQQYRAMLAEQEEGLLDASYQNHAKVEKAKFKTSRDALSEGAGLLSNFARGQKRLQQGSALVNTYLGITQALASYPPPLSFAMAAAQGLAGFAAVADIEKQDVSFGGGGGGGGGGFSAPAVAPAAGPTSETNIFLQGGARFSAEDVRDLVGLINESAGDGVRINASILA